MIIIWDGGTDQQRQWVIDAINNSTYPYDELDANVTFTWAPTTPCHGHSLMCTQVTGKNATVTIESGGDDPSGFPGWSHDQVRENYQETVIHELGHVANFVLVTDNYSIQRLAGLWWKWDHGVRRWGTVTDYEPPELTQQAWDNSIIEAVADTIKFAFYQGPTVNPYRSNWRIDKAQWETLMELVIPRGAWTYGKPIDCAVNVQEIYLPVAMDDGSLIKLQRASYTELDREGGGGLPGPDVAWDYAVTIAHRSGASQKIELLPWNGPSGTALLTSYAAGDGKYEVDPGGAIGDDMTAVVKPFDEVNIRTRGQPWTNGGHWGSPALSNDLDARSGWAATRAKRFQWTLPKDHGWGVVEVTLDIRYMNNASLRELNMPAGKVESWQAAADADGAAAPFKFAFINDLISGKGPWFDGRPWEILEMPAWEVSYRKFAKAEFRSSGEEGSIEWMRSARQGVHSAVAPNPPLDPHGGGAEGAVWFLDEFGESWPASNVGVHAITLATPDNARRGLAAGLIYTTWSNEGIYAFGGLPPGDYEISVYQNRNGSPPEWFPTPGPAPVIIAAGVVTHIRETIFIDWYNQDPSHEEGPGWRVTTTRKWVSQVVERRREDDHFDYVVSPARDFENYTFVWTGATQQADIYAGQYGIRARFFPVKRDQLPPWPFSTGEIHAGQPHHGNVRRWKNLPAKGLQP